MLILTVCFIVFTVSNGAAINKVQRSSSWNDEYNDYDGWSDLSIDESLNFLCSLRGPPFNWDDDDFREVFRDVVEIYNKDVSSRDDYTPSSTISESDIWKEWQIFCPTGKPPFSREDDFLKIIRTTRKPPNWEDIRNLLRTTRKPPNWEDIRNLLRNTRKPYIWGRPTIKPFKIDLSFRDKYKVSSDNKRKKLVIILPIVGGAIILLICKALLCKGNRSSSSSGTTLHPPPRRNASQPTPNRTRHTPRSTGNSTATFASGTVNASFNTGSSSDGPPRYADVVQGDFVVRQTNFPEVHVIPETPPPKYEERNITRY